MRHSLLCKLSPLCDGILPLAGAAMAMGVLLAVAGW